MREKTKLAQSMNDVQVEPLDKVEPFTKYFVRKHVMLVEKYSDIINISDKFCLHIFYIQVWNTNTRTLIKVWTLDSV